MLHIQSVHQKDTMASAKSKETVCRLVEEVTLKLDEDNSSPSYTGLVICADMLIVVDYNKRKLQLHNRHDGELLTTPHQLEGQPKGVCLISNKEVAVLWEPFTIEILSLESLHNIQRVKVLNVTPVFHTIHALSKDESMDNIVLSGLDPDKSLCWCTVSLIDGHVDTIHPICNGDYIKRSHLAVKHNTVYISCRPFDTGVYSYSIPNPNTQKFVYQHKDLKEPMGLTVDTRGYIFVCNRRPYYSIHQLTESGELVTIHRLSLLPIEIFYDEEDGYMYITNGYSSHELYTPQSNMMTRYRLENPHQQDPGIPAEVLKMDARSLNIYKNALQDGKEKVYSMRVMVVGHYGAGKTTLTKRLLGKDVQISERNSTEGIDVHTECCKVSMATKEWIIQEKDAEWYSRLQRVVKLLNEHGEGQDLKGRQEGQSVMDIEYPQHDPPISAERDTNQEDKSTFHPALLPIGRIVPEASSEMSTENKDALMEILRLVNENSGKLDKSLGDYATLSLMDFGGQYVFYTTHQTFLTSRAIYLLVIDLSQQLTELITDDDCFLDMKGIELRKVHDWVEIWLNSIHSCAPSTEDGIPPVILVGTHVDKIPEKIRQQVIDQYFMKLRELLKEKPVRFHLMDDIAIDNTLVDPMLGQLKEKIFEQASKQPYWGEEKPARWLPLEQAIISLKISGVKIVTISDVEKMNKSGSVRIKDKDELDLFLRFQHEMGMILYFSVEGLREKIVLDPQWLINALKSLITSVVFIRKNPAIISSWFDFRDKGILTQELIDAVWTKEKHPELFANKDHILLLMEKLNIIAKPRSITEIGEKENDYYLAPCMLRQKTPEAIICPESDPEMESTSVLCFMSTGKFLPPPIFHRLVGACLTHWAIAKQDEENLIYCGCCVFDFDRYHRLTLHFREHAIFARVTGMAVTDPRESSNLCIEARTFIFDNLRKIVGNLGKSLEFELYIQCPDSKADSLKGLIPLTMIQKKENVVCHSHVKSHKLVSGKLLRFWFEEEEKIYPPDQICSGISVMTIQEECQGSLQKRALPQGKKYHVFFSYSHEDVEWVRETLDKLENDHGFICCEYERDNTPGTPLLVFAEYSIQNSYKTLVVMTMESLNSGFVKLEIDMAIVEGIKERRQCVVPVLLKDCEVPLRLRALNYIDVRDTRSRDIWWPNLLMELGTQENIAVQDKSLSEVQDVGTGSLNLQRNLHQPKENVDIQDQSLAQVPEVRDGAMSIQSTLHQPRGVPYSTPKLLCQILNKSVQIASSSRSILEKNCLTAGLKFHGKTPGDGNCFFEAVSSQLRRLNSDVQKSPQQLRQDVVTFMKTNRVLQGSEGIIDLAANVYDETFDEYCKKMACDREWADHLVILAMARMLQRDIMIIISSPSSGPENNIVWIDGHTDLLEEPILLGHEWEHHYHSLQPIESLSYFPWQTLEALKSSSTSDT